MKSTIGLGAWFTNHYFTIRLFIISLLPTWGAGMAQWWEHSPPTNVARVRFPDSASDVGWVCWFSTLHREVFSGHSGFPSPQKPTFDLIYFHCSFQFTVSPISAPALERLDTWIKFLSFPFLSSRSIAYKSLRANSTFLKVCSEFHYLSSSYRTFQTILFSINNQRMEQYLCST